MNDMEIILNSQSGTGCIFGEEVFWDLQNIRLKMIVKNDLQSFINFLQRKATRTKLLLFFSPFANPETQMHFIHNSSYNF